MNNCFLTLVLLFLLPLSGYAQIGIGTTTPASSAALEVRSTTQGILLPRLSTTQMNAIAAPAPGLLVYNTTANKFYGYGLTSASSSITQSQSFTDSGQSTQGQSVTMPSGGELSAITVTYYNTSTVATTETIRLVLYASDAPVGTPLATLTQAVTITAPNRSSRQPVTFTLPAGIFVATGQKLLFTVTRNNLAPLLTTGDPYPGGKFYFGSPSTFVDSIDLTFQLDYMPGSWTPLN